MKFEDLVKQRYSCRKFTGEKPGRDLIKRVVNTARLAPSAKNLQPWKFLVVDEDPMLSRVKSAYGREWIAGAPVVIVVCGNREEAWVRPVDGKVHTDVDVSIAIDHLTLAATANGLGTCWICYFEPEVLVQAFDLPSNWEPIAMIPIGFPSNEPDTNRHDRLRKPLKEIISFNSF